ncbi:ACP S-malonyltransferase [bacterium]|nr:ACP S-malonyltransferase [bacterium]
MTKMILFPGQGSQSVGMGKDLYENSDIARAIFDEADEALGFKISKICFEGPEEELLLTKNTQPAILTVSYALWKIYADKNDLSDISFMAGHSLGEYTALVASGAISFRDAVVAVHKRGSFMQEAVPVGKGAMAALIDIPKERVLELCETSSHTVTPANFNSPRQIVISGDNDGVDEIVELLKSEKKRAMKLKVSAPFHSPLMKPAEERMRSEVLNSIAVSSFSTPVVANVSAKPYSVSTEVPELLGAQVTGTVKWDETILFARENGVTEAIEVGPGKVLTKLNKQIDKELLSSNISSLTDF